MTKNVKMTKMSILVTTEFKNEVKTHAAQAGLFLKDYVIKAIKTQNTMSGLVLRQKNKTKK